MAHTTYRSRRSFKRQAARSKRNFVTTLIITGILIYATITWVLPIFISSIGFIRNTINPQKNIVQSSDTAALAPPVLNIPYEATNSAQIDIKGYGTPNSQVTLYVDDESKQKVDVSSDGSFNFENITLNLGTNNIYGKTMDEQGKESLPSKTIKLIYNNEKPDLSISEPEDGKVIKGGDKKVKISGKTNPGVHILINGNQVIVDKDGNFSTEQPLNEGDNTISIKAIDITSNTKEEQRKITYNP